MRPCIRTLLIVLLSFLAVTAIPGGIALMAGFNAPPVDMLRGSPFTSFFIPGLALVILVGGIACLAVATICARSRHAVRASLIAGNAVVVFELVEIVCIGSPAGPARFMQILYLALGLSITSLTLIARTRRDAR